MRLERLLMLGLVLVAAGCDRQAASSPPLATPAPRRFEPPQFEDAHLRAGRAVWMGTCVGCHDIGVGGAPPIGDQKAWRPRLQQDLSTLYAHALQGFFGPRGTMMPARGGNDALSDDQVRAAVDYMIAASR